MAKSSDLAPSYCCFAWEVAVCAAGESLPLSGERSSGTSALAAEGAEASAQQRPTLLAAYCACAAVYLSPAEEDSCSTIPWHENEVVSR